VLLAVEAEEEGVVKEEVEFGLLATMVAYKGQCNFSKTSEWRDRLGKTAIEQVMVATIGR